MSLEQIKAGRMHILIGLAVGGVLGGVGGAINYMKTNPRPVRYGEDTLPLRAPYINQRTDYMAVLARMTPESQHAPLLYEEFIKALDHLLMLHRHAHEPLSEQAAVRDTHSYLFLAQKTTRWADYAYRLCVRYLIQINKYHFNQPVLDQRQTQFNMAEWDTLGLKVREMIQHTKTNTLTQISYNIRRLALQKHAT